MLPAAVWRKGKPEEQGQGRGRQRAREPLPEPRAHNGWKPRACVRDPMAAGVAPPMGLSLKHSENPRPLPSSAPEYSSLAHTSPGSRWEYQPVGPGSREAPGAWGRPRTETPARNAGRVPVSSARPSLKL